MKKHILIFIYDDLSTIDTIRNADACSKLLIPFWSIYKLYAASNANQVTLYVESQQINRLTTVLIHNKLFIICLTKHLSRLIL